ncbi:MAG: tetraprenyl-beta-curcumene synthase family protein [Methylocystaceae bacterium]
MLTSLPWLTRYLQLFPQVDKNLQLITAEAMKLPPDLLKNQAFLSLENKAFHCYGGAVMALLARPAYRHDLITLIIHLQTISDYLDNLCDRAGSTDHNAFLLLHQSMLDAINPTAIPGHYYAKYDYTEDSYLYYLVTSCQNICLRLPSLQVVEEPLQQLVTHYAYLQTYKHMPLADREGNLRTYLAEQVPNPHGLEWWELAAATGSTLGMFALLAMASHDKVDEQEISAVLTAYFPWICGLHILLDYLIDQEEDLVGGDLNFVSFYDSLTTAWNSLVHLVAQAKHRAHQLRLPALHLLVISGLLAMYMSDHKVQLQGGSSQARTLIKSAGRGSLALYQLCRLSRYLKGVK